MLRNALKNPMQNLRSVTKTRLILYKISNPVFKDWTDRQYLFISEIFANFLAKAACFKIKKAVFNSESYYFEKKEILFTLRVFQKNC